MNSQLLKPTSLTTTKYPIADDSLLDYLTGLPDDQARDYLFLAPSDRFAGRWRVDCLDPAFFMDFEDTVGRYRSVSPARLEAFLARAEELEYHVVFEEDPASILSVWDHLNDPPEFSLNSDMPNTTNGMLPFQLQGFNYLRRPEIKGGIAVWSTGTGKTALETALFKQHLEVEDYQVGLVVCKRNNKIDTQRKLLRLGGIDYAHIFDGTPKVRERIYDAFLEAADSGERLIGITNYEKFREDPEFFEELVQDRRVVIAWDEMPTRLSNRSTLLYEAVKGALYDVGTVQFTWEDRRAEKLRQYNLSATPIENSPEGVFNQVRLIDPEVWPTVSGWNKRFVASRNFFSKKPEEFRDVDVMGLEIEFMTHQVDKDDPDIAQYFPKKREEIIYVDWSPQDRRLYDQLQDIAKELAQKAREGEDANTLNPLQLIGVLQMLCDAPSMVQASGENRAEWEAALEDATTVDEALELQQFVSGSEAARILLERQKKPLTDEHCNKLDALKELIFDKHPGEKGVVFTVFARYLLPTLSRYLDEWGVSHVVYGGTDKQRQEAIDSFRNDPDIRIFLSSDAGSDSIDLPQATWTCDYDLPATHARRVQRRNRIHRINSTHESVTHYGLQMPNSVEDRKAEILEKKKGYHDEMFRGEIAEEMISARMTADDLWYILTGD